MKFHEEYFIENAYFFRQAAKYCFIYDKRELNKLEANFLKAIDYRLVVDRAEQERYFALITDRAQEMQCKKFRVYCKSYTIVENYFAPPKIEKPHFKALSLAKPPPVFLNGKFFKDREEVFHFFHCEDICEDKSTLSDESSLYTLSEDSPILY